MKGETMILFPKTRQALAAYREADRKLRANYEAEVAAGITWETQEFLRLNDEGWATHDALPWWLRWVLP